MLKVSFIYSHISHTYKCVCTYKYIQQDRQECAGVIAAEEAKEKAVSLPFRLMDTTHIPWFVALSSLPVKPRF